MRSGQEMKQSDNATETWEFFRRCARATPLCPMARSRRGRRRNRASLGEAVLVSEEMRFTNQRGEVVARLNSYHFRFDGGRGDRTAAASRGPIRHSSPASSLATSRPRRCCPAPTRCRSGATTRSGISRTSSKGEENPALEHGPMMAFDIGRFNAVTIGHRLRPDRPHWACAGRRSRPACCASSGSARC